MHAIIADDDPNPKDLSKYLLICRLNETPFKNSEYGMNIQVKNNSSYQLLWFLKNFDQKG